MRGPTAATAHSRTAAGQLLNLVGVYDEFYGLSQLTLEGGDAVESVGSGDAPAPAVVADPCSVATGGADAEPWEGVLVQVADVTVTSAVDEFGTFVVDGCLKVDRLFFSLDAGDCAGTDETPSPAVDQAIAGITGVLTFTYDEVKLEPRSAGDYSGWTP